MWNEVHDGMMFDGHLCCTAVNVNIVIATAEILQVEEIIDLNAILDNDVLLGWCRSILVQE